MSKRVTGLVIVGLLVTYLGAPQLSPSARVAAEELTCPGDSVLGDKGLMEEPVTSTIPCLDGVDTLTLAVVYVAFPPTDGSETIDSTLAYYWRDRRGFFKLLG